MLAVGTYIGRVRVLTLMEVCLDMVTTVTRGIVHVGRIFFL